MKQVKRITAFLMVLLLCVGMIPLTARAETVYTVTLDPGEGIGEPVVYSTTDRIMLNWRYCTETGFCKDDDGSLLFHFDPDVCPEGWTPQEGYVFDSFRAGDLNSITQKNTVFTAKWRRPGGPVVTIAPEEITLSSNDFDPEGYAPLTARVSDLDFGPNAGIDPFFHLELHHCILDSSDVDLNIYTSDHSKGGRMCELRFIRKNGSYDFAIHIDPEILYSLEPGTYTSTLRYDVLWNHINGAENISDAIPLTLEVSEDSAVAPSQGTLIRCLFDPNSGEHFYTASEEEMDILTAAGWIYESESCFTAPAKNADTIPVYRLYDPNAGDHHFTADRSEVKNLDGLGWISEGIGFYAYAADSDEGIPMYRAYDKNTGHHFFTTDKTGHDSKVSAGCNDEGIAWKVLG